MVIFILFISMILYILLININLNTEDDFDMHKKKCQNQNKLQRESIEHEPYNKKRSLKKNKIIKISINTW